MTKASVQDVDLGYEDLLREIVGANGAAIEVGIRGGEVAQYAAVNEFGSSDGHVPERSFLRSTIDENKAKYAGLMQEALGKILFRGGKAKKVYAKVGRQVVFDIQRKISSRVPPPNAPATLAKKRGTTPLINTGDLHTSIRAEVIE